MFPQTTRRSLPTSASIPIASSPRSAYICSAATSRDWAVQAVVLLFSKSYLSIRVIALPSQTLVIAEKCRTLYFGHSCLPHKTNILEDTASQRANSLKGPWEVMIRYPWCLLVPIDDGRP